MRRNNFVKIALTLLVLFFSIIVEGQTVRDVVFMYNGGTQIVDVLANDNNPSPSTLTIVNDPGNYAKVVNNRIELTIPPGGSSFYSVQYRVQCNAQWYNETVFINLLIPFSRTYSACPGASLSLGFPTIGGRQYYWFDDAKNPINSGAASDAITATAPNTFNSSRTYYVRALVAGDLSDYIPITVNTDADCGSFPQPSCATTGTLLFREDFGGNSVNDPTIGSTPISGSVTEYLHQTSNVTGTSPENGYWLLKQNSNKKGGTGANGTDVWHSGFSDHTHPGDNSRGYMFMVNAATDQKKFFECDISGLCDNMELYFSVQVHNLMFAHHQSTFPHDPNLRFELVDAFDKALGVFITGDIGRQAQGSPAWKHYGFKFTMPAGYTSLKLKIINNSLKSNGNDFALDDIEVRFCAPPVSLPAGTPTDITLCPGSTLELKGSYTNTGNFFTSAKYQWERNANRFASSGWTTVAGPFPIPGGNALTEAASTFTIPSVAAGDAGYYRLAIADDARLGDVSKQNCRAMSEPIKVTVHNVPVPAINQPAQTILCNPSITLTASAAGQAPYTWYRDSQVITGQTGQTLNATQPGSYQVSYSGVCQSQRSAAVVLQSCLRARNDTVFTYTDTRQVIDVLANDDYSSCQVGTTVTLQSLPANGAATVASGNRIEYTPGKNFTGIDQFQYKLACGANNGVATVYVVVINPLSRNYTACPGTSVTLGFNAIQYVTYDWYYPNQQTLVGSGNTMNATAPASGSRTYYIRAKYNGVPASSFMSVTLNADADCGTPPSGCAATGTLLFREDFGGNSPSDLIVSTTPLLAGTTGYTPSSNNAVSYSKAENYWLLKYNANHRGGVSGAGSPVWHSNFSDHTNPGDVTRGYMFMVDASDLPTKFFEYRIRGLCEQTELYFSVQVHNLMVAEQTGIADDPDLRFELFDSINNTLGVFVTGRIGREPANSPAWKHYGFKFAMPAGHRSLTLKIVNNSLKSSGNDFALDDIEVRFCAPPVTLSFQNDTTACFGSVVELKGSYNDNGTFDDATLQYQWVLSENKPFDQTLAWTVVSPGPPLSVKPGNTITESDTKFDVDVNKYNLGYYRLIVMDGARANQYGCRAMSDPVKISGRNCTKAITDTVATSDMVPVTFNPLANDSLGACHGTTPVNRIGVVANAAPKHGSLTVNPGATLTYTPVPGFGGVDSADYYIICGADSSAARIYFMSVNFEVANYVACQGGTLKMEIRNPVSPPAGIQYDWYSAQRNGAIVANGSNSQFLDVVKDAQPSQTWWIETKWRGMTFPRVPAVLTMSANCGSTALAGCATDGTVIWKETFDGYDDGLNPGSLVYSRDPLPGGTTTYSFANTGSGSSGLVTEGYYSIVKGGDATLSWVGTRFDDDHTFPGNTGVGRYFIANGRTSPDKVYEQTIQNVCPGTSLYFSFWLKGLTSQLTWRVYSATDNRVLATLVLPKLPAPSALGPNPYPLQWKHYGFNFDVPAGVTSIKFDIYNNEISANDNDFAVDDIEVRLCAPVVSITPANDIEVCAGTDVALAGSFTNSNNTFTNDNLASKWLYSANGTTGWTEVAGSGITGATGSITNNHTLTSVSTTVSSGNSGYYRMVVSDGTNINSENCRASSKTIKISAKSAPTPGTVSTAATTVCGGATPVLNVSGASGSGILSYQWQYRSNTVTSWTSIGNATGASYQSGALTETTEYRVVVTDGGSVAGCNSATTPAVTITVDPTPHIGNRTASVCSTVQSDFTPTAAQGELIPSGTQYTWTFTPNTNVTGGTVPSSPQSSIIQTLINTTDIPQYLIYSVIPVSGTCSGTSFNLTVTVNPKPTVGVRATGVCSAAQFDFTPTAGSGEIIPSGTQYTWTVAGNAGNVAGAAPETSPQPSISGTLTTGSTIDIPQDVIYSVTPVSGTCSGTPFNLTVTVTPIPTVKDRSTTVCSGNRFDFTPTVTGTGEIIPSGTQYTWTVASNYGGVGGALPETSPQSSIHGTLNNGTGSQQIVNYTVIPETNGCSGPNFNMSVMVTNSPTAGTLSYNSNNPMCRTAGGDVSPTWSAAPSGGGQVSYSSTQGLTISATDGKITPASSTAGSYTVTYEMGAFGGCASISTTANVTIADLPAFPALNFTLTPLCEGAKLQAADLTAPTVTGNNSAVTSSGWEIDDTHGVYGQLALPLTVTYNNDNGKHIRYSATNGCGTTNGIDNVTLTVMPGMIYPDIRVWMCPDPAHSINLSSYLDTLNFKNVLWSRVSKGSPDFLSNTVTTRGTLPTDKFSKGTHVYRYDIENGCGKSMARAYVLNAKDHVLRSASDTVVVCVLQPMTAHMQLNQIMGMEADGTWQHDPLLNPYVSVLTSPSRFEGARIFNAIDAWTTLRQNPTYSFPYNNDPDAALFKFRYDANQLLCNGKLTKEIVIIVTSKLIP